MMTMKTTKGFDIVTTSKILESVEASMYEDLFDAIPTELGKREVLSLHRHAGALYLTAGGHDHPMFNRVMGVGLGDASAREAAVAALEKASEHYQAAGVRRWMIQLLPHMESEAFREAAAERGVIQLRGWAKHLAPARVDVPSKNNLQIVRLDRDLAGGKRERLAEAWARIVVKNFRLPADFTPWLRRLSDRERWLLYVALDGKTPVATAALFLSDIGGERFAELSFASTLQEFRGRGAQSALISRRVADARNFGARWIASETDEELPDKPNPSYRNLVRLGFPVVYVRANWGPPKPSE